MKPDLKAVAESFNVISETEHVSGMDANGKFVVRAVPLVKKITDDVSSLQTDQHDLYGLTRELNLPANGQIDKFAQTLNDVGVQAAVILQRITAIVNNVKKTQTEIKDLKLSAK